MWPAVAAAKAAINLPYKVLYALPHNPIYFTQGLVYEKPFLYESTGLYAQSKLIKYKVQAETIQTLQVNSLSENVFAEGITLNGDNIVLLSYKQGRAWVYNKDNFQYVRGYQYKGEGWGLTAGLGKFYMSNGTDQLLLRSKKDFSLSHNVAVTFNEQRLKHLNELEWIHGHVAANIWYKQLIVLINPLSGRVAAYIDLAKLIEEFEVNIENGNVANGIAYDQENNILYVTGKRWSKIFAVSVDFDLLNNKH